MTSRVKAQTKDHRQGEGQKLWSQGPGLEVSRPKPKTWILTLRTNIIESSYIQMTWNKKACRHLIKDIGCRRKFQVIWQTTSCTWCTIKNALSLIFHVTLCMTRMQFLNDCINEWEWTLQAGIKFNSFIRYSGA